MSTVRLRRLKADFEKLQNYVQLHPRVKMIQFDGDPPERYQIEYRIRSLRQIGSDLKEAKSHMVEIVLPRNYPRTPPQCRMLSPVFHPNIAPHAICVGDHWSAGESLQSIVIRIGEMLAYQSYNVKSPLNGDAARWVEQNAEDLPLDDVSLLVEESDSPSTYNRYSADDSPFEEVGSAYVVSEKPARQQSAPAEFRPAPTRLPVKTPDTDHQESITTESSAPPRSRPAFQQEVDQSSPSVSTSASVAADVNQPVARSPSAPMPEPPTPDPRAEKIPTVCTHCGARYRVSAFHRGRTVACQNCGVDFVIS